MTLPTADHAARPALVRAGAICALLAFATLLLGWTLGGLAQPSAYSSVRDDTSDLGALTAASPWLFNQLGDNLTGLLVIVFAVGLWVELSPDIFGRLGALAVAVTGAGAFVDGLVRLDCRGIDAGCKNVSWHAHAHKIESGVTGAAFLLAPLILAFAFRRVPGWRDAWLPTLATVPALIAANVIFSAWGDGAATRAGTAVGFAWMAYIAVHMLRGDAQAAATA
jgi:hypothetical protein